MSHASGAMKWWEKAVVYQLYVRSFADTDGDGKGDLAGIRSRLPYLADLGVDAVWLNPCYPSPQFDHGYDVSDYFDIEPDYGTLADFDALVAAAAGHGIRILMDVVPNHCSWDHAWFKSALAAPPGSPERARFYFLDGKGPNGDEPPNNWTAIFGGSVWHRVTEADGSPGQWYLGVFTPQQPDMNWNNPEVVQHFDDMLRFWFDRGAAGFRADAVATLMKTPGFPDWDEQPADDLTIGAVNPHYIHRPEGHEAWKHWRQVVDRYNADHPDRDIVLISEAYMPGRPDLLRTYVRPEEFHQAFAFDLLLATWNAAAIRGAVTYNQEHLVGHGLSPAWTVNNHDAQRTATKYGHADAETFWSGDNLINSDDPVDAALGLRRARAMALFQLALPGAVYLYGGEELGLPEVLEMPDSSRQDPIFFQTGGSKLGRDGCRVPLPWTADPATNFGFSAPDANGAVAAPWMYQPADWGRFAADAQAADPASTLAMYRRVIAERRARQSFDGVPCAVVADDDPDLVIVRRGDLIAVLNVGGSDRTLDAELVGQRNVVVSSLYGLEDPSTVPANTAVWIA